jgi:ABC-type sugar transport system substrate-binding protein
MSDDRYTARADHVLDMANAALDAMKREMDGDTTTAELFSVIVTILAQFVQILVAQGVDPEALKKAVNRAFPPPMVPEPKKWMH